MTLQELNRFIIDKLTPVLGIGEAKATARLLIEDDLHIPYSSVITRGERPVEPETVGRFTDYVRRVAQGEPPQYVVGSARFMGMDLSVSAATLIPRPETAELVDIIVDNCSDMRDCNILDVGTGSGCIAIALARAIPFARLTAIDISPEALGIARKNAESLGAKIDFILADISDLNHTSGPALPHFDIIVSNPPYIALEERANMESRVLDYEPHSALFVPDDNPLLFYRAILNLISDYPDDSRPRLFFEINPRFAGDISQLLTQVGYDCSILLDSNGHKRFAIATPLR